MPAGASIKAFRLKLDRFSTVLAIICIGYVGLALLLSALYYWGLPDARHSLQTPFRPWNRSLILASDGSRLMSDRPFIHQPVRFKEIPVSMRQSTLAALNCPSFFQAGTDPWKFLQASFQQQPPGCHTPALSLARQLYRDQAPSRLHEALLAIRLENELNAEALLSHYLNRAPWGKGVYGVEAASQVYFRQPARTLSWSQAALLAGLLDDNPDKTPYQDLERTLRGRETVFEALVRHGLLSRAQARKEAETPAVLDFQGMALLQENQAPAFNQMALQEALKALKLKEKAFWQRGYMVYTTLDPEIQENAQLHLGMLPQGGALMTLDRAGRVLAYASTDATWSAHTRYPAGTLMQPLIAAAALEAGISVKQQFEDAPIDYGHWRLQNPSGLHYGHISLSQGVAQANTTLAAHLVKQIKAQQLLKTTRNFGISREITASPLLALGGNSLSLPEATAALSVFQRQGRYAPVNTVQKIVAPDGKVLYSEKKTLRPAIKKQTADTMLRILSGLVEYGPGQPAALPERQVAGAIGQSSDCRAAWFVGMTPQLTTGLLTKATPATCNSAHLYSALMWRRYTSTILHRTGQKQFQLSSTQPILGPADFTYSNPALPVVASTPQTSTAPAQKPVPQGRKPAVPAPPQRQQPPASIASVSTPAPAVGVSAVQEAPPVSPSDKKRWHKVKGWVKKSWEKTKTTLKEEF